MYLVLVLNGVWLPSLTSLPSDALSSVKSPSVAAVLDQSNLDGLGLLVIFKTDQVGIYSLVLCMYNVFTCMYMNVCVAIARHSVYTCSY